MFYRFIGHFALAAAAVFGLGLSGGCQGDAPPAAATNLTLTDTETRRRSQLTPEQQQEALAAMRSVAEGAIVNPPRPARHGMRWSDMHAAVIEATLEREIAVYRYERTADHFSYLLRTIDGRPGRLEIRRRDDEQVYDAEASIGRFGDESAERMLLEALDRQLRAFGRKRQWDGEG